MALNRTHKSSSNFNVMKQETVTNETMEREAFAARIRAARERLGLTQKAAAARWGVSRRSLEGWEAGYKLPVPFIREHLARKLAAAEKAEGRE